ncbi:MAG: adenylate/guanylate cyclase domain-containing protein, partial [Acidimicrobiia bacterium]|nr:adenylate/guanylate cyclase domain-containing protein [Acidimicrobiia bacterium]
YVGLAVNKAARVASAAEGGEILLSSTTRELVGDTGHTFGDERIAELHGLDGQHRLIPLTWQN